MTPFNLTGPLPTTTTLLEASAGTGKTYAIAALAVRYIAEAGQPIGSLLLITFGNHAAGELRSRVLARLHEVVAALDSQAASPSALGERRAGPDDEDHATDPLVAHLLAGDVPLYLARLRAAIAEFNDATIVTTHSFCQTMLRDLGILGDWDPNETVGPDPLDLIEQCAVDTYIAAFQADPEPPFSPSRALKLAQAACTHALPLLPAASAEAEFCARVRDAYRERKARAGICTFDDVTARLRALLQDEIIGATVARRLREAFPVVMVDEFQDTDPHQWAIIETAFVAPDRPTILIGDPKQSIYGFRGADLESYLQAHDHAELFTLDRNFRSDPAAVAAVVELFGDLTLGSPTVRVTPVTSSQGAERLRLPARPGLWLRRLDAFDGARPPAQVIDDDLAMQLQLLTQHAQLPAGEGLRPVGPADIAVLVRTGQRARQLRAHLTRCGIPAVLTGSQSVWEQPAAAQWAALLRALADPTQANIRVAALTELVGASLSELFADGGREPGRVSALVRALAHRFASHGALGVLDSLRAEGLEARLLAEEDGPRTLADLAHLAVLLDEQPGTPEQLLARLQHARVADQHADSIRLATDEAAVRVMTIHAAKGLEFPIVALPETAGTRARRNDPFTIVEGGNRCLYVGPAPDWRDELTNDLNQQHLDEELRLAYVATTRAKHLTIAWHATDRSSTVGPLATLLERHGQPAKARPRPLSFQHITVTDFTEAQPPTPTAPAEAGRPGLAAGVWARTVDQTWRRTSYSGLTAGLHEAAPMLSDEAVEVDVAEPDSVDDRLAAPSPMAGLPAGAGFGTLVHAVFERLDWARPRLADSAAAIVAELGPEHALPSQHQGPLTEAVIAVATTPLRPLTGQALADIDLARRLPELDFDLPLADRGTPTTVGDLAQLLGRHLPADDPLAPYPARLAASDAADQVLNGFLTGSIDAVLQLADESFLVVDYKTNRLGGPETTLGHYTPTALAEAMMQAHYPLQAILYCAALHRFLGLRLPGYRPERHLGGVGYLFLRGMAGPDTPLVGGSSCGVMAWRPSAELVVAVSELLGGSHA